MGHDADMASAQSYPRRNAVTRRFTLGAPRDIVVGADGARVAFLRSSGPEDPVNGLWVFDVDSATERRVVDPAALGADDADLPSQQGRVVELLGRLEVGERAARADLLDPQQLRQHPFRG